MVQMISLDMYIHKIFNNSHTLIHYQYIVSKRKKNGGGVGDLGKNYMKQGTYRQTLQLYEKIGLRVDSLKN